MKLFRRRAVLTVDRFRIDSEDGLDFRFEVKASTKKEPNTARITVWNLAPERRAQVEQKGRAVVLLEVGYEGRAELHQLFLGEMRFGRTKREDDGSFATELEAGDGERAYRGSRVSASLRRGTSVKEGARKLADAMLVDAGNILEQVGRGDLGGVADKFENGTVFDGATSDEMDRLSKSVGLDWSIQGGTLQFTPRGRGLRGDPVLLSARSGLVGSPSIDSEGEVEARALIIPELVPARRVKIESVSLDAIGYVREVTYQGSSFENDWYADMKIRPERRE